MLGGMMRKLHDITGFLHGRLSHLLQFLEAAVWFHLVRREAGSVFLQRNKIFQFRRFLQMGQECQTLGNLRGSRRSCKVKKFWVLHASYDGIEAQKHHPPELMRGRFPGSGSIGSWASELGNGARNLIGNSDISYEGTGFSESFRFNKVLQGQEIFPNLSYGRGLGINQVQESSSPGIVDGVQAPSCVTGWSSLMQGYTTSMCLSALSVQVSSPSSVLMFQQPSIPASNFHAPSSVNSREKFEITNHSSFDNSERFLGKLTSSLPCERSSPGMESQQSRASLGLLKERRQLGFSNLPLATQSSFRGTPDLVSTRKSSCKLFGFPLTEGSPGIYKEGNPTVVKSPCAPKSSLLPHVEEQLNSKPQIATNLGARDIYTARDHMLLDIAM